MKKQPARTSRLVWPTMLAIHIVGEEHRLDRARLVVAIEKLAQASRQKRHQLGNFAVRNVPEPRSHPEKFAKAQDAVRADLGRRLEKKRLQVARELLELIIDLHKPLRIFGRVLPEFRDRAIAVSP